MDGDTDKSGSSPSASNVTGTVPGSATTDFPAVDAFQTPEVVRLAQSSVEHEDASFLDFIFLSPAKRMKALGTDAAAEASATRVCTNSPRGATSPQCTVSESPGSIRPPSLETGVGNRNRCRAKVFKEDDAKKAEDSDEDLGRPLVSKEDVVRYMNAADLEKFLKQNKAVAEEYFEGVAFPIGEGGREFLRAALLLYTDGRTLQGASVPQLLKHSYTLGLWPLVQRIRAERSTGALTGLHLAFTNFKAAQSRRRRRSSTSAMHAIRDADGKILSIIYDPSKTLPIGLHGRSKLKVLITKRLEEDPNKADGCVSEAVQKVGLRCIRGLFLQTALLIEHGLDGVRLRDATVAELLAVAWVLGLWRSVEEIAQANEEHKRSVLAQKAAAGDRNVQNLRGQGRKRCTRHPQSAEGGAATADLRTVCNEVTARRFSPDSIFTAGKSQYVDDFQSSTPSSSSVASPPAALSIAHTPSNPAFALTHPSKHQGASGRIEAKMCHSTSEICSGSANHVVSRQSSRSNDPNKHLERIGQLVSAADPADPNAKAVAAEIVKELLALVKKRVLPDPPAEVLTQLQSAAARLGVHVPTFNSPKAFGSAEPPSTASD